MEMDPNCLDDNMDGIQDESSEKLLSPSSSDVETFGELQVLPHVGEEYQAVIPPLIGEFKSALIIVKSTDSELNVNAQNSLVLGLPIPLMRARNGVENKNGTLEAENSEGSQITANNDYAEPKVEHPDNVLEDQRIRIPKLEVMDIDLVLPCALKSMPDQLERGVSFLPGSLDESWNDVERDCFLLGLYIFGKDLILLKKFVDSKDMGDILAFYYGKFYRSDEYHRWSECRKLKNRQFIHGQRIFTGWRHQELLSRVFSHVSEECKSMVLEVSRRFGEGKMSFEEYVLTLKNTVGISILIEAVGIGKGKQDLTGTTMEPPKANRVNSGHSEIPSGKACSSLTSADIIKFLTGGFRLSKARSSDIFWEAVWPRLLARGWHSEQPKDQGHLGSKNPLVFLIPAVKKFSRRRLVKGNHYFDSITDVLNKVALDPGLLEIEVEGTQGTANKEENGWDPSITQPPPDLSNKKRNCYLQLRNSNCNQDLMKFTIVDTSTIQEAQQPKVRELRSLPVEIAGACTTPSSISSESEHDASEDSEDEAEETKISHATGDMIDRGACSESSDCVNSNMNTGMTKTSDRTNVAVGNHEYHSEIVLGKKQQRKSTKYRFSRKISPGHLEYLAPITKRQDVTSCLQGESSCSIENISAVRKPTEDESHCRSNSLDACDDMNSQIRPPQNLSPASSLAKGSPDGSNEGFITENLLAREASPEKPQPFELFDLNYPEVSLDFEAEEPVITDMVQNNDNSCADKSSVPSETSMLSEPLKLHDVEARPDQNPIVSNRRQSTRNRPLTTKALEALACGFFNPKRKRKVSEASQDNSRPRSSRRVRGRTVVTAAFRNGTVSDTANSGEGSLDGSCSKTNTVDESQV